MVASVSDACKGKHTLNCSQDWGHGPISLTDLSLATYHQVLDLSPKSDLLKFAPGANLHLHLYFHFCHCNVCMLCKRKLAPNCLIGVTSECWAQIIQKIPIWRINWQWNLIISREVIVSLYLLPKVNCSHSTCACWFIALWHCCLGNNISPPNPCQEGRWKVPSRYQ